MSTYTDGATLPFPPSPFSFLLQNFFLYSCLGSTLSLCEHIIYILHSNTWSKDSSGVRTETKLLVTLSLFLGITT